MAKASVARQNKQSLVNKVLQRYNGDNKEVIRSLLEEVNVEDCVSIIRKDGSDVTGAVLNLFYPRGDPFFRSATISDSSGKPIKKSYAPIGIEIDEAQAEEVADYKDIQSYRIITHS